MMRAYGIAPDRNPADNFSDAGNTYYTDYLAAAKRLGITAGAGNDMYAPGKEITRQEMITLLVNALKAIDQLPHGNSDKALSRFKDADQIAPWAKDAMTLLVETGTVGGNGGKLGPKEMTTRAETPPSTSYADIPIKHRRNLGAGGIGFWVKLISAVAHHNPCLLHGHDG